MTILSLIICYQNELSHPMRKTAGKYGPPQSLTKVYTNKAKVTLHKATNAAETVHQSNLKESQELGLGHQQHTNTYK